MDFVESHIFRKGWKTEILILKLFCQLSTFLLKCFNFFPSHLCVQIQRDEYGYGYRYRYVCYNLEGLDLAPVIYGKCVDCQICKASVKPFQ